jgi:hypothetical protein
MKAAFLVAPLAFAAQARAGGASGVSGSGTGGPQIVHPDAGAGGGYEAPPTVSPRGSDGVPLWYSVNGIPRVSPDRRAAPVVVQPTRPVPRWYAVG